MSFPFLFPRELKFSTLFKDIARDIVEASTLFKELSENYNDFESYKKRAAEIERRADASTHAAIQLLNTSFITPFDREDIHYLVHELDSIVDILEDQFRNIYLYNLTKPPAALLQFAELILEASTTIQKLADKYLDPPTYTPEVTALKQHLYTLEAKADQVFANAIQELFASPIDPIELIKRKDVLEGLERVMDQYLAVANTVENIILKAR